jgi:hypothetical protein
MGTLEIFNKLSELDLLNETVQGPLEKESAKGALVDLTLKQALDSHATWKNELQTLIQSEDCENLDVVIASGDCYCTLGKWLYGKGKAFYGRMPEFEELRLTHANLHLCAGEVLTQHILGNSKEAKSLLKTKFNFALNKNKVDLVRLFAVAKK